MIVVCDDAELADSSARDVVAIAATTVTGVLYRLPVVIAPSTGQFDGRGLGSFGQRRRSSASDAAMVRQPDRTRGRRLAGHVERGAVATRSSSTRDPIRDKW